MTLIAIWCACWCRIAVELSIYGAQPLWYIYKYNLITYSDKQKDESFRQNWDAYYSNKKPKQSLSFYFWFYLLIDRENWKRWGMW